jgi:hypothetical protein
MSQNDLLKTILPALLAAGGAMSLWAAEPPPATTNSVLRLTGIVSIGEFKRAYIVQEERGHAPRYFSLREGQTLGGLRLSRVDAEHGEAHLVRDGQDVLLSFPSQDSAERRAKQAEKEFVEEHTREHEELQRRERERLARANAENPVRNR